MKQLTEKDRYLLGLAGEWWEHVRESEVEEMLDNGKWKDHYPDQGRDEVRKLVNEEVDSLLEQLSTAEVSTPELVATS